MCHLLSECNTDRALGRDDSACVCHQSGLRIQLHLYDGVAVFICHVEAAVIRVKGDKSWCQTKGRIIAKFCHVTCILVNTVNNDRLVDTVGTDQNLSFFVKERGTCLSFSCVSCRKRRKVLHWLSVFRSHRQTADKSSCFLFR